MICTKVFLIPFFFDIVVRTLMKHTVRLCDVGWFIVAPSSCESARPLHVQRSHHMRLLELLLQGSPKWLTSALGVWWVYRRSQLMPGDQRGVVNARRLIELLELKVIIRTRNKNIYNGVIHISNKSNYILFLFYILQLNIMLAIYCTCSYSTRGTSAPDVQWILLRTRWWHPSKWMII